MDSHSTSMLQNRWVRWLLYFAFMTLLGFINTGQSYISDLARGTTASFAFWPTLGLGLSDWYLWFLATPAIIWLSHRYPLHPERWGKNLLVHLACNLVLGFFIFSITVPIVLAIFPFSREPSFQFWPWFQSRINMSIILYFWMYWAILGAILASQYYRQFRDRQLQASRLEAQLAQAQLQMLRMQLHPHFLFNTLHAISALVHKDADKAEIMIARLGELLRTALESAGAQEVSLRQELEFIQPYLEIEKARLGDRLQVQLDIDPEAMDAAVPNFVLQPIVENAIRHGIAPYSQVGWIHIRAHRENGMLRMEVQDNGPGLSLSEQKSLRPGVGITNTCARLQQLYGPHHQFEMKSGDSRGLTVTMLIPAHSAVDWEPQDANGVPSDFGPSRPPEALEAISATPSQS